MTLVEGVFCEKDFILRYAYQFGILIVGNLIDNIPTPKYFVIALQFILGISWICHGLLKEYVSKITTDNNFGVLAQFIAGGIILTNILQVYNWFGKKHI